MVVRTTGLFLNWKQMKSYSVSSLVYGFFCSKLTLSFFKKHVAEDHSFKLLNSMTVPYSMKLFIHFTVDGHLCHYQCVSTSVTMINGSTNILLEYFGENVHTFLRGMYM